MHPIDKFIYFPPANPTFKINIAMSSARLTLSIKEYFFKKDNECMIKFYISKYHLFQHKIFLFKNNTHLENKKSIFYNHNVKRMWIKSYILTNAHAITIKT